MCRRNTVRMVTRGCCFQAIPCDELRESEIEILMIEISEELKTVPVVVRGEVQVSRRGIARAGLPRMVCEAEVSEKVAVSVGQSGNNALHVTAKFWVDPLAERPGCPAIWNWLPCCQPAP